MAHLSKHQLQPHQLEQLFSQLNKLVGKLNENTASDFLSELLGKEEKIMIAKRLAAIVMLVEGNSIYRVAQLLLISPSTTERIKLNLEIGKYRKLVRILKNNKNDYKQFWEMLEVILRAGLPPRGRGRWKSVLKHME